MPPPTWPYLQVYKVRGVEFAYYRRNGKRTRLPPCNSPSTPEFEAAYRAAHEAAENRTKLPVTGDAVSTHSLQALVNLFRADPEYGSVSVSNWPPVAAYLATGPRLLYA